MKWKAPEQSLPSVDRHCEERSDEAIQSRRTAMRSPGLLRPRGLRPAPRNDETAESPKAIVAIGVGCRAGVAGEAIAALARRALAEAGAPEGERRMFTLAAKAEEPGIIQAALLLDTKLTPLPLAALKAQARSILTPSALAQEQFGAPNLAEAAALAGAGEGGRLLGPRLAAAGATCAVALSLERP
jgi:cobalt-precorrin 5A hydrolase